MRHARELLDEVGFGDGHDDLVFRAGDAEVDIGRNDLDWLMFAADGNVDEKTRFLMFERHAAEDADLLGELVLAKRGEIDLGHEVGGNFVSDRVGDAGDGFAQGGFELVAEVGEADDDSERDELFHGLVEKISGFGRFEVGESFGKARLLQVVAKLRIDVASIFLMPCSDGFGNFAQGIEVACRIAVAPSVIGNDGLAALEQIDERLVHVW